MGLSIGRVTGQTTGTYKGLENVRLLQVELFGESPQTVVWIGPSGEESAPIINQWVYVRKVGADKYASEFVSQLSTTLQAGEKELYSFNESGKFARLKMKLDGSVGIKNEVEAIDFLTAFTAYNTAVKNIVDSSGDTVNAASKTALDTALADVLKVISGV